MANAITLAIGGIYISTRHLLFASFLTKIEICEISDCQERASSKRFSLCMHPAARTPTGLLRCGLRLQS